MAIPGGQLGAGGKPPMGGKPGGAGGKAAVMSVQLKDAVSVYDHYMPNVKGGGLFIQSSRRHKLGEEIFLLLTLPDNPSRAPVAGKVVMITPPSNPNGKPHGIGIQFTGDQSSVRVRIENILAGIKVANRVNYTF